MLSAGSDYGIGDFVRFEGGAQGVFDRCHEAGFLAACTAFDKGIVVIGFVERIARAVNLRQYQIDAGAVNILERGHAVAGRRPHTGKQLKGGPCRRQRDETGDNFLRARKQFQDNRGDYAQRAFRAEEELLQVVAGIVLSQPTEAVPDCACPVAPPRAQVRGRACCRSAELRHPRRWSRGCRQSDSCPRHQGSEETVGLLFGGVLNGGESASPP